MKERRTVFTGKSTLKEITKHWHVSLPNMTFYPSPLFSPYFICHPHMPLQCKLYLKGPLLLAVPLYLQVAFVRVSGYYVDCHVGQPLLGLLLLLSLPLFLLFSLPSLIRCIVFLCLF